MCRTTNFRDDDFAKRNRSCNRVRRHPRFYSTSRRPYVLLLLVLLAGQISRVVQQRLLYVRRLVELHPLGASLQPPRQRLGLVATAVHGVTEVAGRIVLHLIAVAVARIRRALAGYREVRLRQAGVGAAEQSRVLEACKNGGGPRGRGGGKRGEIRFPPKDEFVRASFVLLFFPLFLFLSLLPDDLSSGISSRCTRAC